MFKKFFSDRRIAKGVEIEDSIMTVTQKEEAIIEMPFKRQGLRVIWYIIILVTLGLIARVFYLDVIRGEYYLEISKGNRVRSIVTKAPRGLILDKHGKVLARNVPSIDAIIIPSDLKYKMDEKRVMAEKLSEILNMNSGNIEIIMDNLDLKSLSPVLLKENISEDQALILAERAEEFPGIELDRTAIRSYENGPIFSQIIGYDGKITREELKKNEGYLMTDYIGKTGLEKKYENEIRGKHGARQIEVDSLGEAKRMIGIISPVSGSDLVLNIDEGLQKNIHDKILEVLEKTGAQSGAAVAIDPRNGGVLALVSVPSFDNNMFARGVTNDEYKNLISDENLPLFNRSVSGEFPPGSTIKPAIAAGALSENLITSSTIINGMGGALNIGIYRFGDWKVHAPSDVKKAIAESNDIFFYTIGGGYGNIEGLGMSRMKKYYNLFGFGRPTGIDLPMEAPGLIPDEEWKQKEIGEKWYIGNSYHAAIGQGYVRVTPLQLANFTAALANGGTLYSPKIVNRIKNSDGTEKILSPEILSRNFIRPDIVKIIQEGMRMTVTEGTAQALKNLPVEVAGKTGTAEFGTEKGNTHSWFIAYAPYKNPVIALAVIVPGGGEGNSAALPVAQSALEWYFSAEKSEQ